MRTAADRKYQQLIQSVLNGNKVTTRNHEVFRKFAPPTIEFTEFPLVTVKKTAVKKALAELEWFMSGNAKCPEDLANTWWKGQLNDWSGYVGGYSDQLRKQPCNSHGFGFDQIKYILDGIKYHPHSRRLCFSTWNTGDMADIVELNGGNYAVPSTCHMSFCQVNVEGDKLNMYCFNRSQDVLLGTPHNWVQHWALLTFFAAETGYGVGTLYEALGDAHIYNDLAHLDCAYSIVAADIEEEIGVDLWYNETHEIDKFATPKFQAADFQVYGEVPKPLGSYKLKIF